MLGDHLGDRNVLPAQVGSRVHEAVRSTHHTCHSDPGANEGMTRRKPSQELSGQRGNAVDYVIGVNVGGCVGLSRLVEDVPAQPDGGQRDRVDLELDGEDDGALWRDAGHRRRSPRTGSRNTRALHHQPQVDELSDESANGRAIQPSLPGQLRPGHCPTDMQTVEDGRQIVTSQFLAGEAAICQF